MKMTVNASLRQFPTIGDAQIRTSDDTLHYCKVDGVWTLVSGDEVKQGPTLPAGPAVGDVFIRTSDDTLHYCKIAGAWTFITGPVPIPQGPVLPPGPLVNELFIRTSDDTLYYCKTAGVWTFLAGSIQNRYYDAVVNVAGVPGVDCDYTDIQAALTAGAKTIFVRKGVYNLVAELSLVSLSDVYLTGEEWSSTIIQAPDSLSNIVVMLNCNSMTFENLRFRFNNPLSGKDSIFYISGDCSRIHFRRCWFEGDSPRGAAAYVERGIYSTDGRKTYWDIEWCRFEKLAYSGITLYDGGSEQVDFIKIVNNTFTNGGRFGLDTYIGCHYFVISFNHFENLEAPVADISGALFFNGGGGGSADNIKHTVSFNAFVNVPLAIQFSHDCHEILITGNVFDQCDVNIRMTRENNTRHHISNNFNHGASISNVDMDYANLDADAIFYFGGNWQDLPWRYVGSPSQPGYQNGWGATPGTPGAGFVVNDDHEVVLRGSISSGALGAPAFTLPPNYNPPDIIRRFIVPSGLGTAVGIVDVNTLGQVIPMQGDPTIIILDGIRFRVN